MDQSEYSPQFEGSTPDTDNLEEWQRYRDAWDSHAREWQSRLAQNGLPPTDESQVPGWDNYCSTWRSLWETTGKTWRFEPEIRKSRQEALLWRLRIVPDIASCRFPFSDERLTRADIEYLLDSLDPNGLRLSTHTDWASGLDLRGAHLDGVNLRFLPLRRLRAGLTLNEWQLATSDQRECACIDLTGATLSSADLEGAILRGAYLDDADLFRANLRNSELHTAHLRRADLRNANLQGANLRAANLEESLLNSSLLDSADLHRAILKGSDLSNAQMRYARLTSAELDYVIAEKANFDFADLRHGSLLGGRFRSASFNRANLSNSCCDDSDLRYVQAIKAAFYQASLRDVDLSTSRLDEADFTRAVLFASDLREAHLGNALLKSAELVECELGGSDLHGANLGTASLGQANLRAAQLQGADLTAADLHNAVLADADLTNSKCTGASFLGATMTRACLKEARLERANFQHADLTCVDASGAILTRAVLDGFTQLDGINLRYAYLADISWGSADLAVIKWNEFITIGEERSAKEYAGSLNGEARRGQRISMLETAVRAYRQIAVALQDQGIDSAAHRFSYAALRLQRQLYYAQGKYGLYAVSWVLEILAGYGYVWWHTAVLYVGTIITFTAIYFSQSSSLFFAAQGTRSRKPIALTWSEALEAAFVLSVTSFHGRGFFSGVLLPSSPVAVASAFEAVVGFIIEISFIATFTRRFFGR